jgi:hypothetical protein
MEFFGVPHAVLLPCRRRALARLNSHQLVDGVFIDAIEQRQPQARLLQFLLQRKCGVPHHRFMLLDGADFALDRRRDVDRLVRILLIQLARPVVAVDHSPAPQAL